MKKIWILLLTTTLFISCNDGDVIVTNFDFQDAVLQDCGEAGGYVFFKINPSINESISLLLSTQDELFLETGTETYELSEGTNTVNYRSFDNTVTGDYFCNPIPPTTPLTVTEFLGYSGTVNVTSETELNDNDSVETVDSDSVLSEGTGDLDNDGLPNFIDFDDDGDNVPTSVEVGLDYPDVPAIDTDSDGIPDYLDPDDDNDGVLTINEDMNGNMDPRDDIFDNDVGPNYLNPAFSESFIVEGYREHSFTRLSDGIITISNLTLFNAEEELTFETFNLGALDGVRSETIRLTPEF